PWRRRGSAHAGRRWTWGNSSGCGAGVRSPGVVAPSGAPDMEKAATVARRRLGGGAARTVLTRSGPDLGRYLRGQGLAADRAVAGAQFVGLQGVDDTQGVRRRAADVQVGDVDVLHDVVRVDHEGGAQGDAFFLVKHAQRTG